MRYYNIVEGIFIERVNRFIAHVDVNGKIQVAHVKNTGRCKEILIEGSKVFLQEFEEVKRKTKFDLISVYKGNMLINIDSQVPNKMLEEWILKGNLFNDLKLLRREVFYGNSRFDFYVEYGDKKGFIEVKGVTLEENGVVLFPDAKTLRGIKHLNELIDVKENGYEAYVIFIIQLDKVKYFTPNYIMHREFGETLHICIDKGVNVFAFNSHVSKDEIYIKDRIEVIL